MLFLIEISRIAHLILSMSLSEHSSTLLTMEKWVRLSKVLDNWLRQTLESTNKLSLKQETSKTSDFC